MVAEFRLLGMVEVHADGLPVAVRGARQQSILALLLVEANRLVQRDQLLERAWGNARRPDRPANAVHTQLTLLRRALRGVDGISIAWQSSGYRCTIDERAVDLHLFRALLRDAQVVGDERRAVALIEQALRLWRGDPFTGLDAPWFAGVRAALEQERRAAELDLTDARLRCGEHATLLPALADAAREYPLDERVAGQLMLALYRSGRGAEALAHYGRVRSRLAADLGLDPSPPLQELHLQLLAADPALRAPQVPTAASDAPRPRQLPAPPPWFTGRDAELAAVTSAAESARTGADGEPAMALVAITGTGGVGKTWLALHWAHQHRHRFPDGQLFVDLRGFSPDGQPMAGTTALRGLLSAVGVDDARVPTGLGAQAALWRSLVADQRMLIVLDNAADSAQVAPLLPGGSLCTVLVTSRDHLSGLITGHDARSVSVDVLASAEARALLSTRLGVARLAEEPAAVEQLLACCGGLPLALSIVAGRAATRPGFALGTLAAELVDTRLPALDDHDLTASLPAVLSWSYDALGPDQARLLGLLALAPGPDIGLATAVNLTDLPPARTRSLLRGLEQASLLGQASTGRFRMHDLIRLYAAERAVRDLGAPERDAALHAVTDFYLHTLAAANELLSADLPSVVLDPPGASYRPLELASANDALHWIVAEHACLLAAQRLAVERGWHRQVYLLAAMLANIQHRRGQLPEGVQVARDGLAAAEQLGEPTALAIAHQKLGGALSRVGQHDLADEHLARAVAVSTEAGAGAVEDRVIAHAYGYWSAACNRRGDDELAVRYARAALRLFQAAGDSVGEAAAFNSIGWSSARLGDYARARESCEHTLALAASNKRRPAGVEAAALDTLGYIADHTGDHEQAVDYYQRTLTLCRELGYNTYQEANTLERLGHPLRALGRSEGARVVWEQALVLYREQHRGEEADRVRGLLATT